eukprot:g43124.t1
MAQVIANEYDLVVIRETWLQDGYWELNIQEYQTIQDRQEEDDKWDLIMGNEEIVEALNRYCGFVFTAEDTYNMPVIDDKETK